MAIFNVADSVGWLVLLPMLLLSLGLAAAAISHFSSLMRSLDIFIIGLLIRNAILSIVAIPLIINVTMNGVQWTQPKCCVLVWFIHTNLYVSLILSTLFVVDRLFLLRKDGGPVYNGWITNRVKPLILISLEVGSGFIAGFIPVNLWTNVTDNLGLNTCTILPSQLNCAYSMTLIVLITSGVFIMFICCMDGYFYLCQNCPTELTYTISSDLDETIVKDYASNDLTSVANNANIAEKQLRAQNWESWLVTTVITAVLIMCNHIPLMIIDIHLMLNRQENRHAATYIWLLFVESLCLPNILWIISHRYRHAIVRVLNKIRGKHNDEDVYCSIQAFQKQCTLKGSVYRKSQETWSSSISNTKEEEGQIKVCSNYHHQDSISFTTTSSSALDQMQLVSSGELVRAFRLSLPISQTNDLVG